MAKQKLKNAAHWGVVAEFANPAVLMKAAQRCREAGYKKFEVWSPFPIHGMDDAMGLTGSKVPWIALGGGLTGMGAALLLQWWTGAQDYPVMYGGKPFFAWEFALPVTFEITVLLAAFGTVFGMFGLNFLPRPNHPLDRVPGFKRVTDDKFFLSIEAADAVFDLERSQDFLKEIGGTNVTVVEE